MAPYIFKEKKEKKKKRIGELEPDRNVDEHDLTNGTSLDLPYYVRIKIE